MASRITNILEAKSSTILITGMVAEASKTVPDAFISIINCGIIIGKPSIAMIAAFCCALAAMAAKKVNTRLKLHPPKNTNPIKTAERSTGYFMKSANKIKLRALITSIKTELKSNFAKIKLTGLVID